MSYNTCTSKFFPTFCSIITRYLKLKSNHDIMCILICIYIYTLRVKWKKLGSTPQKKISFNQYLLNEVLYET